MDIRQTPIWRDSSPSPGVGKYFQSERTKQDLLSQSLGAYPLLQRHISDVSNITYSGYLLKRSQQPYRNVVSPFPAVVETAATSSQIFLAPQEETAPKIGLFPKAAPIEDYSSGAACCSNDGLEAPPKKPLHLLLQSEPVAARTATSAAASAAPIEVDHNKQQNLTATPQRDAEKTLEESLSFAASFFGIRLPPLCRQRSGAVVEEKVERSVMSTVTVAGKETAASQEEAQALIVDPPQILRPQQQRSSPIKVHSNAQNRVGDNVDLQANSDNSFRMSSATEATTATSDDPMMTAPGGHRSVSECLLPADVVDEKDGHLWRAKYCVLEEGILYFYRHQTDAESPEAHAERLNARFLSTDPSSINKEFIREDLSKSPISYSLRTTVGNNGHSPSSSTSPSFGGGTGFLWEKRVALDRVGSVRTAEQEYGTNSFELSAMDAGDESDNDILVLRARTADEMNEWLFQFHRSIAHFVMDIMDHVEASAAQAARLPTPARGVYMGDIHHPTFSHKPLNLPISIEASPSPIHHHHTTATIVFSPRFQTLSCTNNAAATLTPSLSHGHGRYASHRRRIVTTPEDNNNNSSRMTTLSSQSFSEAPALPFLMSAQETPNRAMTPFRKQKRFQRQRQIQPPERRNQEQQQPEPEDTSAPELSAPQSAYPETERPPPTKPPSGKYLPPHLRKNRALALAAAAGDCGSSNSGGGSGGTTGNNYTPPPPAPHVRNSNVAPPPPAKPAASSSSTSKKYVPPHLRNKQQGLAAAAAAAAHQDHLGGGLAVTATTAEGSCSIIWATTTTTERVSLGSRSIEEEKDENEEDDDERSGANLEMAFEDPEMDCVPETDFSRLKMGGCADPGVVSGSILDRVFIPRKASRLGKVRTDPFGCFSSEAKNVGASSGGGGLRWELGAVSECGIRDSNEDSYLVSGDLGKVFEKYMANGDGALTPPSPLWNRLARKHSTGLFAIFDGHCGDQASRFAAERLASFIYEESACFDNSVGGSVSSSRGNNDAAVIEAIVRGAIRSLDRDFCNLCVEDGRAWESGTTALVAALVNEHLVIANVGDARGVFSRTVEGANNLKAHEDDGWSELPSDDYDDYHHHSAEDGWPHTRVDRKCVWKEVTDAHSPSRKDELERIEKANGWITTEKEIPLGQLHRMCLVDGDVTDILRRCFSDRYQQQPSPKAAAPQRILQIDRVCGELAVSRSIGDRDFKAAFNCRPAASSSSCRGVGQRDFDDDTHLLLEWDCPLFLPYPADHSRKFVGDLVSSEPDFRVLRVGQDCVADEFLLLACDGLWDVMDADDAVRVARDLLFVKRWTAKRTAERIAELAIHLGSSDNITVIVVRFFRD